MPTVLVVGTNPAATSASAALRAAGFTVLSAPDGAAATGPLSARAAPVLVLDLTLPLLDHAALIQALAPALPAEPVSLADLERRHIAVVLEFTGGNRRDAAHILGIARSTLLAKLRRYGLDARS